MISTVAIATALILLLVSAMLAAGVEFISSTGPMYIWMVVASGISLFMAFMALLIAIDRP